MKENQNIIILEQSVLECKGKFRPKKKNKENQDLFSQQVFPIFRQRQLKENSRFNEK